MATVRENGRLSVRPGFHACLPNGNVLDSAEIRELVGLYRDVLPDSTDDEAMCCLRRHCWSLQDAVREAVERNPKRKLSDGQPLLPQSFSYVHEAGKMLVDVAATGVLTQHTASNTAGDVLRSGDRVELHSLKAKPEYNGKSGTLVACL